MGEGKEALLVLLTVLFAVGTPLLVNDYVLVSDFWERQRVSAQIISEESLPRFNPQFEPTTKYFYPMGFDAMVSFLGIASGLSFLELAQALGFIVMALLAMLVYLFVGRFCSHRVGALAALFVAFMPRIARLGMQPIPEMIGLVLIVAALFLLWRKNYFATGLVLGATLLFHFRSFFNLVIIIALFALFFRKQVDWRRAWHLAIIPILLVPVYLATNILELFSAHSISNPFVFDWNPLQVFGPVVLVSVVAAAWAIRNRKHFFLVAWLVVFALLYALGGMQSNIFQFREMVYAFVPVAALAALFLESKLKYFKVAFPIAAVAMLFMLSLNLGAYPPIDNMDQQALKFMQNSKEEVIMGSYVQSYGIPVISGKKVVVGAFLEGIPNAERRLKDLVEVFSTHDAARAKELVNKYGTSTLFVGRLETRNFYGKKFDLNKFEAPEFSKLYANDNDWVLRAN